MVFCKPMTAEEIREQLLIVTDEQAEALRQYLEQEESKKRAEELLDSRLRARHDRGLNFCI